MLNAAALHEPLPAKLPAPPTRALRTRLARGSVAPPYMDVRAIAPPDGWSRVVPMSIVSGEPLFARDRRPTAPRLRDRIALGLVAGLSVTAGALALLLLV